MEAIIAVITQPTLFVRKPDGWVIRRINCSSCKFLTEGEQFFPIRNRKTHQVIRKSDGRVAMYLAKTETCSRFNAYFKKDSNSNVSCIHFQPKPSSDAITGESLK